MSGPVLVASDFSPCAARAVAVARRLAAATGAPLHALHVLSWPDAGPFEVPGDAPTAAEEEAGETALARAALAEAVPDATPHLARGNAPAPEIAAAAERIGAAVVVVGACGRRRRRIGLGGVAGEVAQTAPADVVVVPDRDADPGGRVLVGVDFSGAAPALVRLGRALADGLGVGLDLVHVVEPLPLPVRLLDQAVVDLAPRVLARAREALRALADAAAPGAELYVERGSAARSVVAVAEALGSGLVVVGPHAERVVWDGLLGSVADGVALRAACPVWIARGAALAPPSVDARSYRPAAL